MGWTNWQTLILKTPISDLSFQETLFGGQAFRWSYCDVDLCWQGIWSQNFTQLRLNTEAAIECRFPEGSGERATESLRQYLLIDTDWSALTDQLPWRSDRALADAICAFRGLRLLNQPFAETLLCFLCSATKQIPQIKIMCENLAREIGSEIIPGGPRALPTWEQLSKTSESVLRSLGLGFRAKNIKKTADLIAGSNGILEEIEELPYEEAKTELIKFPGVGSKIADCALLFGAQKYQAFPVDTWILKVLKNRYGLEGWNRDQLEHFGKVHLGPLAGYAQQYLFAYERAQR